VPRPKFRSLKEPQLLYSISLALPTSDFSSQANRPLNPTPKDPQLLIHSAREPPILEHTLKDLQHRSHFNQDLLLMAHTLLDPKDLSMLPRAHEYLNLVNLRSDVMTLYWTN
jgi:hypothetical protein